MSEYEFIDFPMRIVRFQGCDTDIDNPNISWVRNKTLRCDFPDGITIKVQARGGNIDNNITFSIYCYEKHEGSSYRGKMIFYVQANKNGNTYMNASGGVTTNMLPQIILALEFVKQYNKNLKARYAGIS